MDDYGIDTKPYILIVGEKNGRPVYFACNDRWMREPFWTTHIDGAFRFGENDKLVNCLKHPITLGMTVKILKVATVILETTDREYLLQKAHDDHMNYLIGQTA